VKPADAIARVAALTDAEAEDLATHIDSAPAGGLDAGLLLFTIYLGLYAIAFVIACAFSGGRSCGR
jgi:hypothetical protein